MLNIGCHLSTAKGFLAMGNAALSIKANTFAFFTRNPRGGASKEFDLADATALNLLLQEHHFAPIIAHAPYIINCAGLNEAQRAYSIQCIGEDLDRLRHLAGAMYNFHPGSHVGQGEATGIQHIIDALNATLVEEAGSTVLLETMAGKGSELGHSFAQLAQIISGVTYKNRVGVCIDTCHVFDAGYNIKDSLRSVISDFDHIVGISKLKAVHLNDSMYGHLSHKDRHAQIGKGHIGIDAFTQIINHPDLCHLPFVLETPCEISGYAEEIALLRSLYRL